MNEKLVPASEGLFEYTEKRSRFIGRVCRAADEEEAKAFIAAVKKQHRDARHNCWCYITAEGAERSSDDGEPQGTAGLPMLEIFRREGVSEAVCVVTRYFGGVLLGAGGLFRAYSAAAKGALEAAGVSEIRAWQEAELRCGYAYADRFRAEAEKFGGFAKETEYAEDVFMKLLLPCGRFDEFAARINDMSAGSFRAVKKDLKFLPEKK